MLSARDNATLTGVGRGTPMGELMRRYWQPVAAVAELDDRPTKPVRLFGEDLVLYRDGGGRYGLLDRHCAHRRADLCHGLVEADGLRCSYHGWLYDGRGRCVEQPFEDAARPEARFKDKIRLAAYPVEAKAGLLWAYLGPSPAPLVPDWDLYHEVGYKQIVMAEVPCNWFQAQENSIDPIHFEWLHANWSLALKGATEPRAPTHLKIGFDEFEWGFVYRRVRADTDEGDELWTVGRVCLWPNCLYTGKFEWRVPIDDHTTLHVAWFNDPLPGPEPFEQPRIPYWHAPVTDPVTGSWITSHVMNQDFVAWVGQGRIADRTKEHLGESDRGIILLRRRMLEEATVVARGGEPKAVIRDPVKNARLALPRVRAGRGTPLGVSADRPRPMLWHAGQPKAIAEDYARVFAARGRTPGA
ncbi:MAG TPA: aromatic ring-hydroxylating dioxygenase subunit alpha [Methylomirabilota bacterium]|nr:aromatic ring-hydroxylating dioxygenase subunit alpha [Methylomirabilota bacterium]